jgi:hypothetical protein
MMISEGSVSPTTLMGHGRQVARGGGMALLVENFGAGDVVLDGQEE